jgi:hypothetical protein
MKNKFYFLLMFLATSVLFVSCNNNDDQDEKQEPAVAYILNYGSYSGAKSTVTAYNSETDAVSTNYYKTSNNVEMVSNAQYAYSYKGKIYFMGNNTDQVFWVDGVTFKQTENGITMNIVKPRACAGNGNYLYVSCWGGDIWKDEKLSYIAKINLNSKTVEKKIALPGGPEGVVIANNKLYAALNYKDSVAVINLSTDAVSYIATPAVTSYFVKDKSDNLYVSLVSTYSDFSDKDGIGYINTKTDKLDATYRLEGTSSSYVNIMAPNSDFSSLYVMTSAYDANWKLSGAVAVFDVAAKSFKTKKFVEGISGLNGLAFYNNTVFCFVGETVTGNGIAKAYKTEGAFIKDYQTGISPFMLFTVND